MIRVQNQIVRLALLGLAAVAGCAGATNPASSPPPAAQHVDQISAMFASSASQVGVPLRLYLYQKDIPLPQAAAGMIEVLLFEGAVEGSAVATTPPYHIWQFTADELKPFFHPDDYGLWCYHLGLNWSAHPPTTPTVTLVVRYVPLAGPPVYSAPTDVVVSK